MSGHLKTVLKTLTGKRENEEGFYQVFCQKIMNLSQKNYELKRKSLNDFLVHGVLDSS